MDTSIKPTTLPRILIVSRRTIRKNKFVNFVGEYHLDLIVANGAVPVIVPRVTGVDTLLESFEPIHGVLLCEGEDIDPARYQSELAEFTAEELADIQRSHASDTWIDKEKDSIELRLANLCLQRGIPYLGICRGSQVINVACGGTLYHDVEKELGKKIPDELKVLHMNYGNYDGHRHPVRIEDKTPLRRWFEGCLNADSEIMVNSYHHQGVKKLAPRFVPMAHAPDGLIEGFYDPDSYDPESGKFLLGLQFHPERMQDQETGEFDYPVGCQAPYKELVRAARAYQRKAGCGQIVEHETKRKVIVKSVAIARVGEKIGQQVIEFDVEAVENLEADKTLKLKMTEERVEAARGALGKLSVEQVGDLLSFYNVMGTLCSEIMEKN